MSGIRRVLWLLISLAGFASAESRSLCESELHWATGSMVKVRLGPANTASGMVVGPNRVLTVLHAFPQSRPATVEFDYYVAPAILVGSHHGYDLALLEVNTTTVEPVRWRTRSVPLGTEVVSMSFPQDGRLTMDSGEIVKQSYKGLLSSNPVSGGSSGGALLECTDRGIELAGLIRAYAARRNSLGGIENVGYAWSVPVDAVAQFLSPLMASSTH